ncbi:hypothetical protein GCM10012286_23250 [Streptomyces lasiicapitis]|uniref:Transposase n=1 Tax=Streptomyces lasiicapitis TaxID=1923961 RepID=A0ABQ2LRL7_9ACTN|nr:hypothetical protein GCM10012286_23250 [Streptomyces lasiicapitis]
MQGIERLAVAVGVALASDDETGRRTGPQGEFRKPGQCRRLGRKSGQFGECGALPQDWRTPGPETRA